MDDLYSAIGQKLGTSREEAKRRVYAKMYSADPPAVEVLGPGQAVPAAVQYPQVVETREELAREGWTMRTRAGQRFFVGYEVAYDGRSAGQQVDARALLGEALEKRMAQWL